MILTQRPSVAGKTQTASLTVGLLRLVGLIYINSLVIYYCAGREAAFDTESRHARNR